jgi:hypothetical protein
MTERSTPVQTKRGQQPQIIAGNRLEYEKDLIPMMADLPSCASI